MSEILWNLLASIAALYLLGIPFVTLIGILLLKEKQAIAQRADPKIQVGINYGSMLIFGLAWPYFLLIQPLFLRHHQRRFEYFRDLESQGILEETRVVLQELASYSSRPGIARAQIDLQEIMESVWERKEPNNRYRWNQYWDWYLQIQRLLEEEKMPNGT